MRERNEKGDEPDRRHSRLVTPAAWRCRGRFGFPFVTWGSPAPLVVLVLVALTSCSSDSEVPSASLLRLEIVSGDQQTGTAGRELAEPVVVRASAADGRPASGVSICFEITAGGGTCNVDSALTNTDGIASAHWTLGVAPVWNRLAAHPCSAAAAEVDSPDVVFSAWAEPAEPPELELVYQAPAGIPSEDLAFWPGRGLFLGSAGAILTAASPGAGLGELEITGEEIQSPVGIAFGRSGDLYVSDNPSSQTAAVKRINPAGDCTTLSAGPEGDGFALPNDIAVAANGTVYVAATCDNAIYRISPDDGETVLFLSWPGPNGLAFSSGQNWLYFTTESPLLFCSGKGLQGGLFRVSVDQDGRAGEVKNILEGVAVAGDGLTFDAEGNLYVVLPGLLGGGLEGLLTSGVFVYTPDGKLNRFLSVRMPWDILTNVAFGVEPFDGVSLYCYGFTGRLYRVRVGIPGLPLF